MVEPIYCLKPAWCGRHLAGLRPETGLAVRYGATAFKAVGCHFREGSKAAQAYALLCRPEGVPVREIQMPRDGSGIRCAVSFRRACANRAHAFGRFNVGVNGCIR